jgi:hypothetical protein
VSKGLPSVSLRRVCRALDVSRSSVYLPKHGSPTSSAAPKLDEEMAGRLKELVQQHPTTLSNTTPIKFGVFFGLADRE